MLISCDFSQDSAHLIVTILDENDNIPMFANLFYNATIVEEQDTGTQAMVVSDVHNEAGICVWCAESVRVSG